MPTPAEIQELASRYVEGRGAYLQSRGTYQRLTGGGASGRAARADIAIERMQADEQRAVAHMQRLEDTRRRAREEEAAARAAALERAAVPNAARVGDPVAVATGTFITAETDAAFRHGDLEVAVRRTYRSGRWPAGSFGLWIAPVDTRIIRGVRPNAAAALEEARTARAAVGEARSEAVEALTAVFGAAAVSAPDAVEADLVSEVTDWELLREEARDAESAAEEVAGQADALDAAHGDWQASSRYAELRADARALAADVEVWLARGKRSREAFRTGRRLLGALDELVAEAQAMLEDAEAAARHSREAATANRHALRPTDPDYLELTGADRVTLVDESGIPHVYRRTESGELQPQDPALSRARLRITSDAGYERRTPDGTRYRYGPYGLLQRITDRNGNSVELRYDGEMRAVALVDSVGRRVELHREGGRVTAMVDPLGAETHYGYDTLGRLVSVTDPMGDRIRYEYEGTRLVAIAKPDGTSRRYVYDRFADGWRVTSTVDEEGHAEHFRYPPQAGYTEYENPSGVTSRHYYDAAQQPVRTLFADGSELRRSFDRHGRLLSRTTGRGHTWRYEYDAAGNRTAEIGPDGVRREWRYEEHARVVSHTDGLGRTTRVLRDERGNPVEIIYPDGSSEYFAFTAAGRLSAATDRGGATTRYAYDERGHLSRITHPDGATEAFRYDAVGRLLSYEDETGVVYAYEYRADGLLSARTRIPADSAGEPERISFRYDERKDRIERIDPMGATTTYGYDGRHRLTRVVTPVGTVVRYRYRADGCLTERSVEGGGRVRLEYDGRGRRVAQVQVETGARTEFAYDADGNLLRRRDAAGGVTRFSYSPRGRRIRRVDPVGGVLRYRYDGAGNLTRVIDERGFEWELRHDALDRRTRVTGPAGYHWRFEYDRRARTVTIVDSLDRRTRMSYDERGRLAERRDAAGNTKRWSYDVAGRLVSYTDATGGQWRIDRDGFGRAAGVTDPRGATERRRYDATGNLIALVDPAGNERRYTYDAAGRPVAMTDAAGHTTRFELDAAGRRTAVHYPDGTVERREYDAAGRLTALVDEDGNTSRFSYDGMGRVLGFTDPGGRTRRLERDAAGRVRARVFADGAVTRYEYDAGGNRTGEVDPAGGVYKWEYDHLGNVVSEVNRLGARRSAEYDAEGQLVSRTDFAGRRAHYDYDAAGRLLGVRFGDGRENRYAYDAAGRMTGAANDVEQLSFAYDAAGNLIAVRSGATGAELSYRYDDAGRRMLRRLEPSGITHRFTYDVRGLVTSVTDEAGATTSLRYDPRGREVLRTRPNGVRTETSYTPSGRIAGLVHRGPRGVIAGEAYVYDASGRRVLHSDHEGRVTTYAYDAGGRITDVTYPVGDGGSEGMQSIPRERMRELRAVFEGAMPERRAMLQAVQPSRVHAFEYDSRGNRIDQVVDGQAERARFDGANRLLRHGQTVFAYDASGNLRRASGPGRELELAYGPSNRITAVRLREDRETTELRYAYDALGRRVLREQEAESGGHADRRYYLHDGFSVDTIAEVRGASGAALQGLGARNARRTEDRYRYRGRGAPGVPGQAGSGEESGGPVERFLLRLGGRLLAQRRPLRDHRTYYGVDERGSVIVAFDHRGTVSDRFNYGAFGAADGAGVAYAGKLLEPETGLYDFGYRDYDPSRGRFTSVDPVRDGSNWYALLDGDPVNRRDPTGLFMTVGPGVRYNHRTDRYESTDAIPTDEKSLIRIERNSEDRSFYNDRMRLIVDDLVLTDTAVQSEADSSIEDTIPAGEYDGYLMDFSGTYDDPILLVNEELETPVHEGNLIHPNEYTNPDRIAEAVKDGEHTGPWDAPLSLGCQITRGVEPFNELRDEIARLGYRSAPGSHYTEADEIKNNPDLIPVEVKNR